MIDATDLAALDAAVHHAVAYRRDMASAERTPTATYAEVLASLDRTTPETGADATAILEDLVRLATPGLRSIVSPRHFGWVNGQSHIAGVAADWLASAWGQNGANRGVSPAAAAFEAVAADWLLDLLDLPRAASVGFVTGATVANFVCLCAARGEVLRRVGWDVESDGLFGAPPITVLIGADAHSTVFNSLRYAGLGSKRVVPIATDDMGRILLEAFRAAVDALDGPAIAIAQAGQINTGASDPFDEVAPIARDAGVWLHVDGAFGLWAQAAPGRRDQTRGVEQADSWATDGHKWLQTPYDCGFAIVRDEAAHRRAMQIVAPYLPDAATGEREPSDFVPELSRRARGFATWTMLRRLGRDGIAEMVERHCRLAGHIGESLGVIPGIELVAPVVLNQAILAFGDDDTTLAVIRQVQDDAIAFVGPSQWRGRWVMRVSVSSNATQMADAEMTVAAIRSAFDAVRARI